MGLTSRAGRFRLLTKEVRCQQKKFFHPFFFSWWQVYVRLAVVG
jgi:hypothetical protein